MGHEGHHHEEKTPLSFFASPLLEHSTHHQPASISSHDIEDPKKPAHHENHDEQPFENMDSTIMDSPAYRHHAEATTAELFYDLFFVANLTSFTSLQEINDHDALVGYIGFFSLLWLTWYQVSLYDVRFSSDSIFERVAKAIHFGVMIGFTVMGAQWKPGKPLDDYRTQVAFGLILMVSRLTLFCQYGVTLFYSKKFRKTILPLALVMAMTLIAAILYGATTAAFPKTKYDPVDQFTKIEQNSNVYIAWYVIGITEALVTVAVSCIWRIVSFKGTHMVQRMSLLTLIILGEGIIVIAKAIAKIIKNEYNWTSSVIGQVIAATLIIYFFYMLYFDRMQEEHFGTIRQQVWSFLHFPLHVAFVLALLGISLLIVWRQAVISVEYLYTNWDPALSWVNGEAYDTSSSFAVDYLGQVPDVYATNGTAFTNYIVDWSDGYVYAYLVDSKTVNYYKEYEEIVSINTTMPELLDSYLDNPDNATALNDFAEQLQTIINYTTKTLFDTFSVNVPKQKVKVSSDEGKAAATANLLSYIKIFELVMSYAFVAVSTFFTSSRVSMSLTFLLGWSCHCSVRNSWFPLATYKPASRS